MAKKITAQMLLDLFLKGVVIHRAWIRPPGCWEYSVQRAGETTQKPSIATRSSLPAAYNAALDYLSAQQTLAVDASQAGSQSGDGSGSRH